MYDHSRVYLAGLQVLHHASLGSQGLFVQPQHVRCSHGTVAAPHIHLAACRRCASSALSLKAPVHLTFGDIAASTALRPWPG